jgi:hypothetical protein
VRELAVGADHVRPERGRDLGQRDVLGLALEGDPHEAVRPLDDKQLAERRGQAGEDGVGEPLAHRGGGDGLEQRLGQGGHA